MSKNQNRLKMTIQEWHDFINRLLEGDPKEQPLDEWARGILKEMYPDVEETVEANDDSPDEFERFRVLLARVLIRHVNFD